MRAHYTSCSRCAAALTCAGQYNIALIIFRNTRDRWASRPGAVSYTVAPASGWRPYKVRLCSTAARRVPHVAVRPAIASDSRPDRRRTWGPPVGTRHSGRCTYYERRPAGRGGKSWGGGGGFVYGRRTGAAATCLCGCTGRVYVGR